MGPLSLLAQASASSIETIALVATGLLGGTGILLAAVMLMARGYWSKNIAPLIQEEVQKWYGASEQIAHREKELQNTLRSPHVLTEQKTVIKEVLDNEIKRSDGLISQAIHTQVSDMETRLMSKLDEMSKFIKEDTEFKQDLIQRLARLEGAVQGLMPPKVSENSKAGPLPTKSR
jgi:hypothetical protein